MKKSVFLLVLASFLFSGCYKQVIKPVLSLNDTISVPVYQTRLNPDEGISLTLDSVPEDSRCPDGAMCVWAGNAVTAFKFTTGGETIHFNLNTLPSMRNDTTLAGYHIRLIGLTPYPSLYHPVKHSDYVAKILIRK
jgi:hypothetical protein